MTRVIEGDGSFSLCVVGESYREANIRQVFGHIPSGQVTQMTRQFEGTLTLEDENLHDSNAVRVDINGIAVGYLSRKNAPTFRVRYASADSQFRCGATITYFTGGNYASNFSIRLDVPLGPQLSPVIHARRRADRAINEMLGLVKGMLVDGNVTERETLALQDWLHANPDAMKVWPGHVLASRLRQILADGRVDDEEREQLRSLIQNTVGVQHEPMMNAVTSLPLDDPAPPLIFSNMTYVFTGELVYGTRPACEAAVIQRGGVCADRVTKKTDVLVIGCIGNDDWAHTSFGRKIESAIRWKARGVAVTIVSEEHWTSHLSL
jgi:hypothetical protein